jgi:hypothetical protein
MRRLLPLALLAASLAANLALGVTLARRGVSSLLSEPLIFAKVPSTPTSERGSLRSAPSSLRAEKRTSATSWFCAGSSLRDHARPEDRAVVDSTLRQIAEAQARF